jgi:hypothetical protein
MKIDWNLEILDIFMDSDRKMVSYIGICLNWISWRLLLDIYLTSVYLFGLLIMLPYCFLKFELPPHALLCLDMLNGFRWLEFLV